MLDHWIVAPVLVPLAAASMLVVLGERHTQLGARLSLSSLIVVALLAVLMLLRASTGEIDVYLLGNWAVPFGIAVALDRLSALMVMLTATAALVCVI